MLSTPLKRDLQSEVAIRRLRNCQLFDGMGDLRLAEVAKRCMWLPFESGEIAPSRSEASFFIVSQGKIRISALTTNGRELLLADFGQGEHFGGVSLMDSGEVCLQVQALTPSMLACLTRADLMVLIREDVVFREGLLQAQQTVTERLIQRLIEQGTLKLSGRLYSYLLELAARAGIANNQASIAPAPLHSVLATRIAASREEVSRELARLRKLGLITSNRHALVLQDVAALRERLQEQ